MIRSKYCSKRSNRLQIKNNQRNVVTSDPHVSIVHNVLEIVIDSWDVVVETKKMSGWVKLFKAISIIIASCRFSSLERLGNNGGILTNVLQDTAP